MKLPVRTNDGQVKIANLTSVMAEIAMRTKGLFEQGKPVQVDLNDIHRAFADCGIHLADNDYVKMGQTFKSLFELLGWSVSVGMTGDEYWLDLS